MSFLNSCLFWNQALYGMDFLRKAGSLIFLEKATKFYYPDSDNYTYFGSVDYIWLDQIDKVKEKKGVFTLNLKKDFRVLSLPEPLPKNRPVGINVEEPELIKPLHKREIEIQLANDKEISEGIKKDRISMFKSTLERALKQL